MAQTNAPDAKILEDVARQIRERLITTDPENELTFSFTTLNDRGSPQTSVVDMGETFELWLLTPTAVDKFEAGGGDLARLATRTGRLHHQIRLDDGSAAFARSDLAQPGVNAPPVVDEIFVSRRAAEIDKAIERANHEFPDDTYLARLLSAPAYQVESLWFVNKAQADHGVETGGELLIVTAPRNQTRLSALQRIDAPQFLKALVGMPVGMGLIARSERS
ncbi:MAG TPA: hypothetical protein VJT74_00430 [Pyrinomonadaceae bacterium]|nr:hypothetical protein [Pyrinomonadaceae bacterium]